MPSCFLKITRLDSHFDGCSFYFAGKGMAKSEVIGFMYYYNVLHTMPLYTLTKEWIRTEEHKSKGSTINHLGGACPNRMRESPKKIDRSLCEKKEIDQ